MVSPAAVIFIVFASVPRILAQCTIDIRTDLVRNGTAKEPLFLKYSGNEYKLMMPEEGQLQFKTKGNTAVIACTSELKPNFLTFNNKSSSTISCSGGNTFNIDNEAHSVSDFNECNAAISGSIQIPNSKCAKDGMLLFIGFQLNAGRGFVKLIDVCYNKKTASAIYARHIIPGKAIKTAMKSNARPSGFKATGVPQKVNPARSFTKASQSKRLQELLGSDRANELMSQTFLARGHLAPDGDFIFVSWQFSTYYYINTVPQWQSINNANWKHIESDLRSKADKLKSDLTIYTGGFGVLNLNGRNLTLSSNGLEVPKWTWKIAQDSASNSGIAFLTYNNPFDTDVPSSLCSDICNESGWDWKERQVFSKGFTVCCKVADLMRAIPDVPKEAKSTKILEK